MPEIYSGSSETDEVSIPKGYGRKPSTPLLDTMVRLSLKSGISRRNRYETAAVAVALEHVRVSRYQLTRQSYAIGYRHTADRKSSSSRRADALLPRWVGILATSGSRDIAQRRWCAVERRMKALEKSAAKKKSRPKAAFQS